MLQIISQSMIRLNKSNTVVFAFASVFFAITLPTTGVKLRVMAVKCLLVVYYCVTDIFG